MKTATDLDVGLRCIKYLLFAVNFLFVLTGIAAVAVGATLYKVYNDYPFMWSTYQLSPSFLMMIVGVVVFTIAFFGCCGALKESTCMVLTFAVFLTTALVLEMSAVIIAYEQKENVIDAVVQGTERAMHSYFPTPKAADDFLRTELNCCRFTEPTGPVNASAPDDKTCCTWYIYSNNPKGSDYCTLAYGMNCYLALSEILEQSAMYILSSIMLIAFIQLLGITFACTLGRAIRRQKTNREMQRWQLKGTENYQSIPRT